MHYFGKSALRVDAAILHDPFLFVTSIAIAVSMATVAFYLNTRYPKGELQAHKYFQPICGALAMGVAISGTHYTAMAATIFVPETVPGGVGAASSTPLLVAVVRLVSLFIVGTAIVAATVTVLQERSAVRVKNEKRYRDLIDELPEATFVLVDGNIVFVNRAMLALFGAATPTAAPTTWMPRS